LSAGVCNVKCRAYFSRTGSCSATSITLLWDKPITNPKIAQYHLFLNGKQVATADRCNYRLTGLTPKTKYTLVVKTADKKGRLTEVTSPFKFVTKAKGKLIDITDFGAKGDGTTLNTKAIQKAIDACGFEGTVLIPKGVFVSGALFLKSHMTLEVAKGGVLKGSKNEADYLPYLNNRFEGWEMKTFASLLNAGVMDNKGGFSVVELAIKGEGTISGGGSTLAKAMIAKGGMRSRGRLILLMNCRDVDIQGLKIEESPSWTIHYIYSKGISCHDPNIASTARNGDGLDPDSSDDSYIFNCTFNTGDDCIAIKSGKNPEGFTIGKPTRNVNITYCNFIRGHGISIGSEISGGVSGVLVQDCKAGNLLHGLQIKGTKARGGYVRNVTVADCQLLKITIFSAVNYNNDGDAAPEIPVFENFVFRNIDLAKASIYGPVMDLNGFTDVNHKLKDCSFKDIILPAGATILVKDAMNLKFVNVAPISGLAPKFEVYNSTKIEY
jgi:exo-poly-alpha-galacturonosidase